MKRILFAFMAIFALSLASQAQTKEVTKTKTETKSTTAQPPVKAKEASPSPVIPPSSPSGKVKKDGTPDMRYKENQDKPKPAPTKKDGTPDMRYKENKQAKKQ